MPLLDKKDALTLIRRRHPEWLEHQRHWRFLYDSLEGGERYKHADYTVDPTAVTGDGSSYAPWYNYGYDPQTSEPYPVSYNQIVDRNLIPHLRETGVKGRDLYILRLSRTPVPALVERTVEAHLSRVYSREVRREGPAELEAWWADCDGRGTTVDRWMLETAAPLLLVLGQLDLCFDHPPKPPGAEVRTRRDAIDLGLTDVVASVILPENLLWWRLDARGARYAEVLVFERTEGGARYRHWETSDWNVYSPEGDWLEGGPNPFGAVPVVRVFDRRKPRCANSGRSRYESIAALMKAAYNLESERHLSDVQHSHAQLSGPEDFLTSDSEIPVGPDVPLPKKKCVNGSSTTYEGWEYVDPPKGAQEALRLHVQDVHDEADRDGVLAKPAGLVAGTTVAQSGLSKSLDLVDGNALLARVADTLGAAESTAAEFALRVARDGRVSDADLAAVRVTYPKQFDLMTADDLAQALDDIQRIAAGAGVLPELHGELMKRLIDVLLPGLDDARLSVLRGEVDDFLEARAEEAARGQAAPDPSDETLLSGESLVTSPGSVLLSPTPS